MNWYTLSSRQSTKSSICFSSFSEDWGKNYDLSGKYSVEWKVNRIDKHGGDFLTFGEKDQASFRLAWYRASVLPFETFNQ